MKTILLLLLTASLCSCSTTTTNVKTAETFRLQLRHKKGDSQLQRMDMEQVITQTIEGENVIVNQTMGFDMLQEVLDVDADGIANIKITYAAARLKHLSMMGNFTYDSANPLQEIPQQAMGLAAMVGKSFTMKQNAQGEIIALGGLDQLLEDTVKSMDVPEGPMKRALAKALKQQYGEDAMKESMQQLATNYPDKSLAIGDFWEQSFVTTRGFAAIMKNKWTVASRKNGIVTLDIVTQIAANPKGEPMDMGVMKLRYLINGDQKGNIAVNEKTGQLIRSKAAQKMTGTVKVIGNVEGEEDPEWPITIESTITLEVTEKK